MKNEKKYNGVVDEFSLEQPFCKSDVTLLYEQSGVTLLVLVGLRLVGRHYLHNNRYTSVFYGFIL